MKTNRLVKLATIFITCWWPCSAAAELKVATLHPLLTEIARQVGGDRLTVVNVVKPGTDVHHFSPTTRDMKRLTGATLVLASGKGLENYLGKLRDNLTTGQILLEVGNSIPSMEMSEAAQLMEAAAHGHPGHTHGGVDPHWWNSVENVIRAARVITAAFTKADPGNAPFYEANNRAYQKQLTDLRKWALREIGRIPSKDRKLATAHLSMGYFARDFGFKLIPVQGLNPAVPATSQELAAAIDTIRKSKIRAVFPEQGVNPKHLAQMSAETGVRFGGQLIADGNGTGDLASFSEAFAHNVMTITKELAPAP